MNGPDARIPRICSFECPHADFPPAETAGICRTMSAVWCLQLTAMVNKNLPCEWRKRKGGATLQPQKRKRPTTARKARKR